MFRAASLRRPRAVWVNTALAVLLVAAGAGAWLSIRDPGTTATVATRTTTVSRGAVTASGSGSGSFPTDRVRPSGFPNGGPGGGFGGLGRVLNDPAAKAALEACGITPPSFSPRVRRSAAPVPAVSEAKPPLSIVGPGFAPGSPRPQDRTSRVVSRAQASVPNTAT